MQDCQGEFLESNRPNLFKGLSSTYIITRFKSFYFHFPGTYFITIFFQTETVSNFVTIKQSSMLRRIHSVPADYLAAQLAWAETDPKAIAFRLAKKQVADETALQHIANVDEAKYVELKIYPKHCRITNTVAPSPPP